MFCVINCLCSEYIINNYGKCLNGTCFKYIVVLILASSKVEASFVLRYNKVYQRFFQEVLYEQLWILLLLLTLSDEIGYEKTGRIEINQCRMFQSIT